MKQPVFKLSSLLFAALVFSAFKAQAAPVNQNLDHENWPKIKNTSPSQLLKLLLRKALRGGALFARTESTWCVT